MAWLLALAPAFWIPLRSDRPSLSLYWILYITTYVPACIIPWYTGNMEPSSLLVLHLAMMCSFGLIRLAYSCSLLKLPLLPLGITGFLTVVTIFSLINYTIVMSELGFQFRLVLLEEVYDVRSDYKVLLEDAGGLVPYAVGWQANVFNPILIACGLTQRRHVLILLGLLGQVMIYSITGYKAVLFSGLWLLIICACLRLGRRNLGFYIVWGTAVLIAISTFHSLATEAVVLSSITTRRMFVVPGLLTGYYFDFFSTNPLTLLADGALRWFVDYPYALSVPKLIGQVYFHNPKIAANANLWAYGFAAFGCAGLFLFSGFLALVMWLFDSAARGRDSRLAIVMLAMPAVALSNTSLFTCLLTHGLAMVIVMVYLSPIAEAEPAESTGGTRRAPEALDRTNYISPHVEMV